MMATATGKTHIAHIWIMALQIIVHPCIKRTIMVIDDSFK